MKLLEHTKKIRESESHYKAHADEIKLPDWAVKFIEKIFDRTRSVLEAGK